MQIIQNSIQIEQLFDEYKAKGYKIGFVPSMGALHDGHIKLIKTAKTQNEIVISSIFVNPSQFSDKQDYLNYPKTPEKDIEMLIEAGCDVLFMPNREEIYKADSVLLDLDLGYLDTILEGKFRPGHFKGVITVVDLFFKTIKPHHAYFGKKDLQQLIIIKFMAARLHPALKIISVETNREQDGLAMSSRNLLLNNADRANANLIYKSLLNARHAFKAEKALPEIIASNIEMLSNNGFVVEYFEIVDEQTLLPLETHNSSAMPIACVAAKIGNVRLIDNMELY